MTLYTLQNLRAHYLAGRLSKVEYAAKLEELYRELYT
jgi:hypothetical protein